MRILILALVLASAGVARADSPTAIAGSVVDTRGIGLAGVTLVATGARGARAGTTITEDDGTYVLPVAPGTYAVRLYFGTLVEDRAAVVVDAGFTTPLGFQVDVARAIEETPHVHNTGNECGCWDACTPVTGITIDQDYPPRSLIRRLLGRMLGR